MKKVVLASLLSATALIPFVVQPAAFAQAQSGVQMSQEEYAKYNACQTATAPAQKATACEDYLKAYPNSSVKSSVLEGLVYAYSQGGDEAKALDAADRLLAVEPQNLRALTMEVYYRQKSAETLTDPAAKAAALDKVAAYAQTGLNATKPKDVSDADFAAMKAATQQTFTAAIAEDDLVKKDNAGAIAILKPEITAHEAETEKPSPVLNDVLTLAQAYYTSTPPDYLNCAWYASRVVSFAPEPYKTQANQLASYCFTKYHGNKDGFDAMQTSTKTNLNPPAGYFDTIKPAPKPEDLVAQTIASTPDLATLALSDKEFILQYGKPEDADKVFNTIKGKSVEIPGAVVVAATADQLQVAVSDDAKQAQPKTADFTFNMKEPLKTVPAVGDTVTLDGTYASYTQKPLMITMSDATVVTPKKAAPAHPTHRPATHHPAGKGR